MESIQVRTDSATYQVRTDSSTKYTTARNLFDPPLYPIKSTLVPEYTGVSILHFPSTGLSLPNHSGGITKEVIANIWIEENLQKENHYHAEEGPRLCVQWSLHRPIYLIRTGPDEFS